MNRWFNYKVKEEFSIMVEHMALDTGYNVQDVIETIITEKFHEGFRDNPHSLGFSFMYQISNSDYALEMVRCYCLHFSPLIQVGITKDGRQLCTIIHSSEGYFPLPLTAEQVGSLIIQVQDFGYEITAKDGPYVIYERIQ